MPGTKIRMQETGFEGLVSQIDAAHLKHHSTRGIMQISVKLGADKEAHLQCLSVCAGNESQDSWRFHMESEKDFTGYRTECETIISDRKSGLATVIQEIYPKVQAGACIKHLQDNIKSRKVKPSEACIEK